MGSKQKAPAAPDYTKLAQMQSASSQQAAQQQTAANRINQTTPYGSITYSNTPTLNEAAYNNAMYQYQAEYNNWWDHGQPKGLEPVRPDKNSYMTDQWSSNIQLSPEQQKLFDQQNAQNSALSGAGTALANQYAQNAANPINYNDLPSLIYGIGDGSTGDTWSKYTDLLMQRMNPDLDTQQAALDAKLANQGLTQGSEGWGTQQTQFGKQRNDAGISAQLAGANLAMQGAQLNNATRQQDITERNTLRNLPLQQLQQIRNLTSLTNPTFYTPGQQGQAAGTDYSGAGQSGYNAAMNAVNANNAQVQSNTQAGVGLAVAAASMY